MKSLRVKLALGLVVAVVLGAAGTGAWYFFFRERKPDIDRDGGHLLVYEVENDAPAFDPNELAAAVRRRIPGADAGGVRVRPVGERRVEIAIPRARCRHLEAVAKVKSLLAETGHLEFRIVANSDDEPVVFDSVLNNPAEGEQLKAAAASDKAPPAPRPIVGKAFDTDLGSFTYSWVELGAGERKFYGLDNASEKTAGPDSFWKRMEEARKDHKALEYRGHLFYSRAVANPDRLAERERDKKYEYFILTRDPERDEEGQPKAVTGEYLEDAHMTLDLQDRNAISFSFNAKGAKRLEELMSKNKGRLMAIVLDGVVQSAPNIQEPITSGAGLITGDFTWEEVDRVVNVLRAGALPATLKPQPVSETFVEPRK
jgi:preprotein translocase subunit SecD